MARARLLLAAFLVLAFAGVASAAKIPDFIFATDKGSIALESLRGKVVYLDYWASWCAPCRHSFPFMNEMQARYGHKGLVIVAVTIDSERADARRFLAQYPANFIIGYDPDGATAKKLALKGMPTSFVIDRHGEIVSTHIGFREIEKSQIENRIKALLAVGEPL
jgi:cytochrome c biogenesis protein CcmG/thiol:disulfide interchange protein DsbE